MFGEEEGDSKTIQPFSIEKRDEDIEIIVSTTDQYKQQGRVVNERISWSPNISKKVAHPNKNSSL
jgi:hypothetical protein